jgi:plastocyanin
VATNLVFDRQSITVAANAPVTVNFTNNDTGVPHDFGVSLPGVAHTEACNGPCTRTLTFNSGAPGSFTFQCSIHSDMVGTFTVN